MYQTCLELIGWAALLNDRHTDTVLCFQLTVEYDSDHPTNKSPDWPLLLEFLKQELKKDKGIKILLENCQTDGESGFFTF